MTMRYLPGVCRGRDQPGGPRRCSGHQRARYQSSIALVAELEHQQDQLGRGVQTIEPSFLAELSREQREALWRCGIRAHGPESAADHPIIAERAGDPEAWGFFRNRFGWVDTSQVDDDDEDLTRFYGRLSETECSALACYTEAWSEEMNRAVLGDEPPPVDPQAREMAHHVVSVVQRFAAQATRTRGWPPATVVRGVPVPTEWDDDPNAFFDVVYPVGARVQTGRITSTSLSVRYAETFARRPENKHGYLMVIKSREGLPVAPVAADPFEAETILPPGSSLRCVHVERDSPGGKPTTVYLVEEALVAAEARLEARGAKAS